MPRAAGAPERSWSPFARREPESDAHACPRGDTAPLSARRMHRVAAHRRESHERTVDPGLFPGFHDQSLPVGARTPALPEPEIVSYVRHSPDTSCHHNGLVYVLLAAGETAQLNHAVDGLDVDFGGLQGGLLRNRFFDPGGDDTVVDAFPHGLWLRRHGRASSGGQQQQHADET